MKSTKLFAVIATFAVAGSVFAQEYVQPDAGFVSTKSRAEVRADVIQNRDTATLQVLDSAYPMITFAGSKARSEVEAELALARSNGELPVVDYEYPVVQVSGTAKTRDKVRQELAKAIANGEMTKLIN